jgi:hypothetical protein
MTKQRSQLDQAAKFREVARELGCDESEERFDEALRAVAKQKPKEPEPKKAEAKGRRP